MTIAYSILDDKHNLVDYGVLPADEFLDLFRDIERDYRRDLATATFHAWFLSDTAVLGDGPLRCQLPVSYNEVMKQLAALES